MSEVATDQFAFTRIADFARSLLRLRRLAERQFVDDHQIDCAFHSACRAIWGYTVEDFSDALFDAEDHAFLDRLDATGAEAFALSRGYDLLNDDGVLLSDWWGFCWMILAEQRGLLTPENKAAARAEFEERFLSATNVIGFVIAR